jgi:hypothetical protein
MKNMGDYLNKPLNISEQVDKLFDQKDLGDVRFKDYMKKANKFAKA